MGAPRFMLWVYPRGHVVTGEKKDSMGEDVYGVGGGRGSGTIHLKLYKFEERFAFARLTYYE
jgi:hypothetical protein